MLKAYNKVWLPSHLLVKAGMVVGNGTVEGPTQGVRKKNIQAQLLTLLLHSSCLSEVLHQFDNPSTLNAACHIVSQLGIKVR